MPAGDFRGSAKVLVEEMMGGVPHFEREVLLKGAATMLVPQSA
jgi:hypothetical protein